MEFYLGMAGILGVTGMLTSLTRRYIPVLSAVMVCVFWGVAALRYDTGYDWVVYKAYFYQFVSGNPSGEVIVQMEPLYKFLNFIISTISSEFQALLLVVATFNVFVISRVINAARANILLCLFFYFCMIYLPLQMGVIRQSIAVSFVLLAMLSASRERKIWAWFLMALAIGFHYSSIMYIPVFWRRATIFVSKRMMVVVVVVVAIYLFGIGFSSAVIDMLLNTPVSFISEKIATYALSGPSSRSYGSLVYLIFNCLVLLFVNKNIKQRTALQDYFMGCLVLLVIFQGVFFDFPLLWNRVQYLAILPQAVLLSLAISNIKFNARLIALSLVFVFSMASLVHQLVNPLIVPYIPYYSYIEYLVTGDPGTGMERAQFYYREIEWQESVGH